MQVLAPIAIAEGSFAGAADNALAVVQYRWLGDILHPPIPPPAQAWLEPGSDDDVGGNPLPQPINSPVACTSYKA